MLTVERAEVASIFPLAVFIRVRAVDVTAFPSEHIGVKVSKGLGCSPCSEVICPPHNDGVERLDRSFYIFPAKLEPFIAQPLFKPLYRLLARCGEQNSP